MKHCLLLSGLVLVLSLSSGWADDAPTDWRKMVNEEAEKHEIFLSQSTTAILDGLYTMVPTATFGHGVEGDAALALFDVLYGRFTKWAYANQGQASLKEFGGKYGTPLPPGGMILSQSRAGNGEHIQMIYRAAADGVKPSLTITFIDPREMLAETK